MHREVILSTHKIIYQKWRNDALVRNGTQQELIASQKSLMFNALKLPFHFYDQIKTLFHKFHIFATARGFQSTPLHLERSGLKTRGLISREAWCKATPMNHDIMIHFFVYCWLVIVLQLYGWEQTVIFTWTSLQPAATLLYTELPMFISTSQV